MVESKKEPNNYKRTDLVRLIEPIQGIYSEFWDDNSATVAVVDYANISNKTCATDRGIKELNANCPD